MEITNNGYTSKIEKIGDDYVIAVKDLIKLDGHSFNEFYKKLKTNFSLNKHRRHLEGKKIRGNALTLEGCVEICRMFRWANDELINKLKNLIVKPEPVETHQKFDAEQLVDIELERQRQNKVKEDILKADNIAKLDMILQRVKSIELVVGNIADKVFNEPKQEEKQDGYLRTLFKECMKEIIREELLK